MVMMKKKQPLFTLSLILVVLFLHWTKGQAQSPAPSPSSAPTDIIRILKKAGGFTTLIRLLTTTQVSTQVNAQLLNSNNGLTVFAANDNAFQSLKPGFLNSLNDQQKNELIQFHVLPTFVSISNFDTLSNPVRTQAGDDPDRLALNITSSGNQVNLTTGVVNATLGGSVYSDHQLAIYQVDKVLLPRDFFVPKPPPPAPAPAKAKDSAKKSTEGPASAADNTSAANAITFKLLNGIVTSQKHPHNLNFPKMTKQSLLILLALLISLLHSSTLAAISPATAPAQPAPTHPAAAPTKPLVPTLPQPPSDNTRGATDMAGILKQTNSFNTFLRLMKTTQLINQLNSQLITIKSGGLTVLAADDGAFSELKPGFLNSLSDGQKLELVQFHVLPDFVPASNFDTLTNPVRTLAGNKHGKAELNVISYGGSVNISTGEVNTTITGIVYTDKHLAIYKVGKVLLPSDFFATKKTVTAAPTLAPAPATHVAKAPKPEKEKPSASVDSSETSQVVPTVTSGSTRICVCETWVSLVLGVVFLGVLAP
ncbi:Fasciclin-like arabinogalactan protein 11, partial [Mucuna pruriens]